MMAIPSTRLLFRLLSAASTSSGPVKISYLAQARALTQTIETELANARRLLEAAEAEVVREAKG